MTNLARWFSGGMEQTKKWACPFSLSLSFGSRKWLRNELLNLSLMSIIIVLPLDKSVHWAPFHWGEPNGWFSSLLWRVANF